MNAVVPHHNITARDHGVPSISVDVNMDLLRVANRIQVLRGDLTSRQRLFLDEYMANGNNGPSAALTAGFPAEDCRAIARKLTKLPVFQQLVELIYEYHSIKCGVRTSDLIQELKAVAMSNMADFTKLGQGGEPYLDLTDISDEHYRDKMRAVLEVSTTVDKFGTNTKIKLHNKLGAIDTLLKIAKTIEEKAEERSTTVINNNNSVNTINLVPVPAGKFLNAPPKPDSVIDLEHSFKNIAKQVTG